VIEKIWIPRFDSAAIDIQPNCGGVRQEAVEYHCQMRLHPIYQV
jgi:hypothetical protein